MTAYWLVTVTNEICFRVDRRVLYLPYVSHRGLLWQAFIWANNTQKNFLQLWETKCKNLNKSFPCLVAKNTFVNRQQRQSIRHGVKSLQMVVHYHNQDYSTCIGICLNANKLFSTGSLCTLYLPRSYINLG